MKDTINNYLDNVTDEQHSSIVESVGGSFSDYEKRELKGLLGGTPVNLPTNQADLNGEYTYSNLTEAVNRLNESAARQN